MARTKGSKNKNSSALPEYSMLPTEERITLIANLIIDRVIDDQQNGKQLQRLMRTSYVIGNLATA